MLPKNSSVSLIPPSLCGQSPPYSLASVSSPSLLLLTCRLPYLATGKTTHLDFFYWNKYLLSITVCLTLRGGAVDSLSSNQPSSICCFSSWITKFKKWHHHLARNLCLHWKKKKVTYSASIIDTLRCKVNSFLESCFLKHKELQLLKALWWLGGWVGGREGGSICMIMVDLCCDMVWNQHNIVKIKIYIFK